MRPSEIYQAPYLRTNRDLYPIRYFLDGIDTSNDGLEKQDQVELRTHYDPYIDGDRNATLYSVWFQDYPVMVCKTGGRPDYEHYERYITNKDRFRQMLGYLKSLEQAEEQEIEDVCALDQDIEGLDIVYGRRITLKDLGSIAHVRAQFVKSLEDWSSENAWPYPCSFPNSKPTLQDKQAVRWTRIREDAEHLIIDDPASFQAVEMIRQNIKGTDAIISETLKILRALN